MSTSALRVVIVSERVGTEQLVLSRFGQVQLDRITSGELAGCLERGPLAAAFVQTVDEARMVRARGAVTRIYVLRAVDQTGAIEELDIEDVLAVEAVEGERLARTLELAVRAHQAVSLNPFGNQLYLDTTYNKLFDWFETTRWKWDEIDLSKAQPELLREDEIELLKETAIIEFGTLPGAHNFLREWQDEYSFSSWVLLWGAEEARHSLLQCRYLSQIGVDIKAKHALYKREPYPIGDTRAGTLMMNIISEARAAEYYKRLAADTDEPVIKQIWKLLSQDEARHARSFYVFCKEQCDGDKASQVAALKMAYVWLADRTHGVKHPAGHFYPHSTSTKGLRRLEQVQAGSTEAADKRVFAILRNLLDDDSIETTRDIKARLRAA
jgi:hypothetical protein